MTRVEPVPPPWSTEAIAWRKAVRRFPDPFIVGAPKAGTTSLYAYLEGHPEIYMSPIKEPQYFSTDVSARLRRAFEYPDDEGYLSLFAGARGEKRVGETSTSYLVSKMAPSL